MRRFNRRSTDAFEADSNTYQHIALGLAFGTGMGIVIGLAMDILTIGMIGGPGLGMLLGYALARRRTGNGMHDR